MAEIILYLTSKDSHLIRDWLNGEASIAWLIKTGQAGLDYRWKAVDQLDELTPGEYCLWHKTAGPLNIPSGDPDVPDQLVVDPYSGWSQRIDIPNAPTPWFGSNLPGPYSFGYRPLGRKGEDSIGRSGFNWAADRYRAIGKPATPAAKGWWQRLTRFVKSRGTLLYWPSDEHPRRRQAFAFPEASEQIRGGRQFEVNP